MRRLDAGLLLLLLLAGCSTVGGGTGSGTTAESARLSGDGRQNLGLAQGYLQAGQIDKATARAEMALASDPGSADVHALFGLIHARNGDMGKAERSFARALKIDPASGSILNVHASWLCGRGKYELADAQFVRALADASYPTPLQALGNAGKCSHQAGQWARAAGYLRRAVELSPKDTAMLFLLADSEFRQGRIMEAQAFIQRRDALGSDPATLELAARIEDADRNAHAAARYRQRLKNEFPDYAPTGEGARSP